MSLRHTIYKTINRLTGQYYIGAHSTVDPNDDYLGSGLLIARAIKKYGRQNFSKQILFMALDENAMYSVERELVKIRDEDPLSYNLVPGGLGGDKVSMLDEEKRKLHARKTGLASKITWSKMSKEEYEKRRKNAFGGNTFDRTYMTKRPKIRLFGQDNPFFGKRHTTETKKKISYLHKGNQLRLGTKLTQKSKDLIAQNNPHRKPIQTPFGLFPSCENFEDQKNITIRHIFKHSLDKPITEHQIRRSKIFKQEHLGKTPRQLGYYYA